MPNTKEETSGFNIVLLKNEYILNFAFIYLFIIYLSILSVVKLLKFFSLYGPILVNV